VILHAVFEEEAIPPVQPFPSRPIESPAY